MVVCSNCGKTISLFERKQIYNDKTELYESFCPECKKLYDIGKISFKEVLTEDEDELSLPELQLKEIMEMKKDIHTIATIVLIWFIIGLIGLIISIITWMVVS
jgi:hypothetical protein